MRAVYVGGWMRSGTTLLAELLDRQPGVLAVGEVNGLWDAVRDDAPCSCGDALNSCPVWGPAIDDVLGGDRATAARLSRTMATRVRGHHLRSLLGTIGDGPEVRELVASTGALLRAVLNRTDSRVLVDTSKLLPGLALQHEIAHDGPVDVVHMLRDPRAVTAAQVRTARQAGPGDELGPPGSGPFASLLRWYAHNLAVAASPRIFDVRYRRLRYEELAVRPTETIRALCADLDIPFDPAAAADATVGGDTHIPVGNPARLARHERPVRVDERWRGELTGVTRVVVEVGAAPGRLAIDRR